MINRSKTFRVFVSSTFKDFKKEREDLQNNTFKKLKELCKSYGFQFQAVDLRYGISEEAGLDQRAMEICLEEIERSQDISPKPNFIALLGNRYGWIPLPYKIKKEEFEKILKLTKNTDDIELLKRWYKLDGNDLNHVYELQPRLKEINETDDEKRRELNKEWDKIEYNLSNILKNAVKKINLNEREWRKYFTSATEQEIVNGILEVDNAKTHVHAFFREIKNNDYDENFGDFLSLDKENKNLNLQSKDIMDGLKDKIKNKLPEDHIHEYGVILEENSSEEAQIRYDDNDNFCDDVYNSLEKVILEEIKDFEKEEKAIEEEKFDEREKYDHDAFGKEKSKNFTGRGNYLQEIEDYTNITNNQENINFLKDYPLVIYGESGCGKTALLAQSYKELKEKYKDKLFLARFIGANSKSSDIPSLLKSISQEIIKEYNLDPNLIPEKYQDLLNKFPEILSYARNDKPLIIFIDALNQLTNIEEGQELSWLPINLPLNVYIILSTIEDESEEENKSKKAIDRLIPEKNIKKLKSMTKEEGEILLKAWLKDENRTLKPWQKDEILNNFQHTGSPLFLKLAFEEAKKWKSYTNPEETKLPNNIPEIINKMLNRLSKRTNHGKILTSRLLSYIASSRYGLSEEEIIGLISTNKEIVEDYNNRAFKDPNEKYEPVEKLPFISYSRIYTDLKPYLIEKNYNNIQLLNFYHQQLFTTIKNKYLKDKNTEKECHETLANYFKTNLLSNRTLDELPWQYLQTKDWENLVKTLTNLEFFHELYKKDQYDLKAYWSKIEKNNNKYTIENSYKKIIENKSKYNNNHISTLAMFLYDVGMLNQAYELYDYLLKESDSQDKNYQQAILGNQGLILKNWGRLDEAMELHKEAEKIWRELNNKDGLQIVLGNQALILMSWGRLDEAMELHKEAEKICRELNNNEGLSISLFNQGLMLFKSNSQKGLLLMEEALAIAEEYEYNSLIEQYTKIIEKYRDKNKKKGFLSRLFGKK
ncbi:MAG: DUF4062 domain-containing protein [Methanobrevibacter sp.]|jgi:tetratricopeptide (TPR) repeat protein|nr:DUF4062 domain-containing protein [Methanobrevibacter sp.]